MSTSSWIATAVVVLATTAAAGAYAAGSVGGVKRAQASAPPAVVASGLPQGREAVDLNPADFTTKITNRYWPMTPGSRWVYREIDSEGSISRSTVTVTNTTKRIAGGIVVRALRDAVTEKGKLVEEALEWYAQDKAGNVWYLGEDVKEYENGRVKATDRWEAGVDGAQPGVVMPAKPTVGARYRQIHYAGKSEERAEVFSLNEQVEVPFRHFADVVMIKDTTPLQRKALEYKFYARGVGLALSVGVSAGLDRVELLRYTKRR